MHECIVVRVRYRRKESSRSLSHLLMSFVAETENNSTLIEYIYYITSSSAIIIIISERQLMFTFALCRRPSVCRLSSVVCRLSVVCLSSVCNVRAPYSAD